MSSGGLTRAERFEDEKRRIIESCFSKRDEDGSVLETYITHLRILEFSTHPTSPPPTQTRTPQTEKPRVIIVAVRKSGRVRVHKTKENLNGTFSIGKTWVLDDLSAIESYTGPNVSPDHRAWAGDAGFVVTLGKPYYWEAQSDREKKFFIASLIKIYGKYTGGRVPALSNFDQKELDQVLGGASRRAPSAQPTPTLSTPSSGRPPPSPAIRMVPPPSPGRPALPDTAASSLSNNSQGGLDGSSINREYTRTPSRGPMPNENSSPGSLAPSFDSSRNGRSQDAPSRPEAPAMRQDAPLRQRFANNNKSQDSVGAYRSDNDSLRPRSRGRPNGINPGVANAPEPPPSGLAPAFAPIPSPATGKPPERKRPPMDPMRPTGAPPDENLVPAPLNNMTPRRDPSRGPSRGASFDRADSTSPVAPPPRNIERMSPRNPSIRNQLFEASPPMAEPAAAPTEPARIDTAVPTPAVANGADAESPAPPPSASAASEDAKPSPASPEDERPGLGPMIRLRNQKPKNDLASALWKTAAAAKAFKPRAGGAGAKLLAAAQSQQPDGPDGVTAVVPAPRRPEPEKPVSRPQTPDVPEVTVSTPDGKADTSVSSVPDAKGVVQIEPKKAPEPEPKDVKKRSLVAGNDMRYLNTLGVDASILDNKTAQFTEWLDFFSWVPGNKMRSLHFDDMKIDLDRELNKAQAGGWLARFEEEDERVDGIKKGIDTAIEECEELDNLLTLYGVELSTLQDDIAYIEAQGQGLQVQAANQKLLKKELESLLETCAITAQDLRALSMAPLDTVSGVEDVENTLVMLYKAMLKIDPQMGSGDDEKSGLQSSEQAIDFNGDYVKMRIVQEKKEMYQRESSLFLQRLVEFMAREFRLAYEEVRKALQGAMYKRTDPHNHNAGRDILWKYDPLMLYARDVDLENWNRLIQEYQDASHPTYKMEFRDALDSWKRNARKAAGEEALLFTTEQDKKEEAEGKSLAMAARKLTVKRSGQLARIGRSPLADGNKEGSKSAVDLSRSSPYEVFASVLDDLLPLVEMEQNFIIDFFHATTLEQIDFPDAVAAVSTGSRRGNDLRRHRMMEPDRDLARRVTRSMEVIFPFLERDLANLVDWVLSQSPLQGVGVMASLEKKLADINQTNQDFLNTVLQKVHSNLNVKFKRFADEQIRAIEDTKVKINKRKGVISFIRVFPIFSLAIENMLIGIDPNLNVRRTIDREYDRILKSMFESLKVIARENPAAGVAAAGASADPEDKEALNYHILLIENMNHYIEEVDTHSLDTLEKWKATAQGELNEHMARYLDSIMRRPLGRLLDQIENIEGQLKSGKLPQAVAMQPSNNKATFDKVLSHYDAREVRKGIEALRKRVDKHFDENAGLASMVTRASAEYYDQVEARLARIVADLYAGDSLFEWPRMEVKNAFRGT